MFRDHNQPREGTTVEEDYHMITENEDWVYQEEEEAMKEEEKEDEEEGGK